MCNTIDGDYGATPFEDRIAKVNKLYDDGHEIIVETARGSVTGIDWLSLTKYQLETWGVKYHEVRAGVKFYADYYVDDKAILAN